MSRAAEIVDEIMAARRAGYFDRARPLLDRYARLLAEVEAMSAALGQADLASKNSTALMERFSDRIIEAAELAEALHLRDRSAPPPMLQ